MVYLPEDIQNYIFSFLPIVSEEKKRLNSIVLNYNYYFIRELDHTFKDDIINVYSYWLNINKNIKDFLSINDKHTMLQIRDFYNFAILYGDLIKTSSSF
ncbi:hypothetical protein 162322502 [Organic Lake phycodnavirus 1]|jgi:hypothetical protein|nr:hypothetical protein 162322502 [Organic Lake phycodnavirus 1]